MGVSAARRRTRISRPLLGVTVAAVAGLAAVTAPAGAAQRPYVRAHLSTAVPKGFAPSSLSFASPESGWVLGAVACGKNNCADVVGTTDAGKRWSLLHAFSVQMPRPANPGSGITEIDQATPEVGWAYAPDLYRTTDGGRSWKKEAVPGSRAQVVALASNATESYAVVSPCQWSESCAGRLSLWRAPVATGKWVHISLVLPANYSAVLDVFGSTVYVLDPLAGNPNGRDRLYASRDGLRFSPRSSPCTTSGAPSLVSLSASSATDVSFLCEGNAGTSQAEKLAFRSTDTGLTDKPAGAAPADGYSAQLAVSPSGNMLIATYGTAASYLDINDGHHQHWSEVSVEGTGAGWADPTYVTGSTGWIVYGPADLSYYGVSQVFETTNGGRYWSAVNL